MLNLKEIIDKLSELQNPKADQLCTFICSHVWCFGETGWQNQLADLNTLLQSFTDMELLTFGVKLTEITDPSLGILFGWVLSKSQRLHDLVSYIDISPEETVPRNRIKDSIVSNLVSIHAIAKYSENKVFLQEMLNAINELSETLELKRLKEKIQDKIEELS